MNKLFVLFVLMISILDSCKKDPCADLVNGVYQFPELPENHIMTSQQISEFWDLPKNICGCITTEGLIETCLNYPDLKVIWAFTDTQSAYDLQVKEKFRGVRELETRPDRGPCLLKKYKTLDPLGYDPNWEPVEIGRYHFNIYYVEIIFSQYANLEPLTKNEKISVIETAIVIFDKTKNDLTQSSFGLGFVTTLMGRLMYQNNYEPFIQEYNKNGTIRVLIDYYGGGGNKTLELIYDLSKDYLNYLKNN